MYPVPGCPLVKRGAPGQATGASTNGKMAAYDATAMLIRCNSNPNISRSRQACIRHGLLFLAISQRAFKVPLLFVAVAANTTSARLRTNYC
ncbi:unnamed protein product [Sphagnum troendelagicum]|uniref:Uncharacterized protein n=1 Tax=Sphagnum troendelagicum TaxID=128251 RepID=A0ABP0T9A6_9BRYO